MTRTWLSRSHASTRSTPDSPLAVRWCCPAGVSAHSVAEAPVEAFRALGSGCRSPSSHSIK